VFIEAKDDGGGGDNLTTGVTSPAKLQSNHHHQQTNIQFFTGRMPFLSPNQQCQSTEGKDNKTLSIGQNSGENWFSVFSVPSD